MGSLSSEYFEHDWELMAPLRRAARRSLPVELLMRALFRPVFGWRDTQDHGVQRIFIDGLDASRLALALLPARSLPARGVVLLCHPFLKYGKSYFLANGMARWLADAGWHVAAADFKGFGQSTLGGTCFADDVIALADWAQQRFPGLPLHLVGTSFGAFHGIHAIARHGSPFECAVFDSVPMTIASFFRRGLAGAIMRSVSRSAWARQTATNDLFDSLPAARSLPCLYLFGENDACIEASDIERLRAACPSAQILRFDACGHLEIRKRHPEAYADAVLRFLDAHSPTRSPRTDAFYA